MTYFVANLHLALVEKRQMRYRQLGRLALPTGCSLVHLSSRHFSFKRSVFLANTHISFNNFFFFNCAFPSFFQWGSIHSRSCFCQNYSDWTSQQTWHPVLRHLKLVSAMTLHSRFHSALAHPPNNLNLSNSRESYRIVTTFTWDGIYNIFSGCLILSINVCWSFRHLPGCFSM